MTNPDTTLEAVERFSPKHEGPNLHDDDGMFHTASGDYVRFSDYAALLDAANARIAELEKVLGPFADAAAEGDEWGADDQTQAPITFGECRVARGALKTNDKRNEPKRLHHKP